MYFKDKENTNIDNEFNNHKFKFNLPHINLNNKNLLLIIIGVILLVFGIIFLITLNTKNKVNYFLSINGDELITIYKDNEYIEPGYTARDNKGNDLTKEVIIDSNLDTTTTGDYEIIYTFHDKSLKRYITVTDKPVGATYIYLKGSNTIYLNINDKYIEPGYLVIDSIDSSLTDKVTVYNKIDTSKKGTYQIVYTVTNSTGITTSAKRTVIVMDGNISLSLDNDGYTNKEVGINIYIMDNYFDYLLLPDGTKIKDKSYTYKVTSNGEYKFISYNKTGKGTESTITVSNIDKEGPTGSCSGSYGNGQSTITINAQDKAGISKYNFNGTNYTNNIITVNKEYNSVTITVYDKLGNSSDITCKLTKKTTPTPSSTSSSSSSSKSSSSKPSSSGNVPSGNTNINGEMYTVTDTISLGYYIGSDKKQFSYYLYVPKNLKSNMPLVLYLSGKGELGNDYVVKSHNNYLGIKSSPLNDVRKHGKKFNAIILVPQVPQGQTVYGYDKSILELISLISKSYSINKNKISIAGLSHGCYGTLSFVNGHQNYFSAAVLMGCKCDSKYVSPFTTLPVWAITGAGEGSGNGTGSFAWFAKQINAAGGNAKANTLDGKPHNIVTDNYSVFRDDNFNLINWMISQTKK